MGPKVAAALVMLALAGCQGVGLTSSFCDPKSGIRAIRLSPDERAGLSPGVKRDILAINRYGANNCGWKP